MSAHNSISLTLIEDHFIILSNVEREIETRNSKLETRNKEQETRNKKQDTDERSILNFNPSEIAQLRLAFFAVAAKALS